MKKMFRNCLSLMLVVIAVLSLASCKKDKDNREPKEDKIALVSEIADYHDKGYNEMTYKAMKEYLEAKDYKDGRDFKYFGLDNSGKTPEELIEAAIAWGAKGVICNGFVFEEALYDKQTSHPEVKFLINDCAPKKGDDVKVAPNTLACLFKEEEAGYLAGYSAVVEGYEKVGFIGGKNYPSVMRYGAGFIAGVKEANLRSNAKAKIEGYKYAGTFDLDGKTKAIAEEMYNNGVELIFGATSLPSQEIANVAKEKAKMMIAADADFSSYNDKVLTSAMKIMATPVKTYLDMFFGTWEGGRTLELGLKEAGVGLPTTKDAWRFKKFTVDEYDKTVKMITERRMQIPTNYEELEKFCKDELRVTLEVTKEQFLG